MHREVPLDGDLRKATDREKDLLDAMPLPGTPVDEAERKGAWTALPLRVRTALRRMHRQSGHPSPTCALLGPLPSTFRRAAISDAMPVKVPSPNLNLPR